VGVVAVNPAINHSDETSRGFARMPRPSRNEESARTPAPAPTLDAFNVARQALSILLSATALAWLARLLVLRDPVQGAWALQVMMSVAAFMAGCWGAAHRYRTWTLPMAKLRELLPRVREGELTIDALLEVDGGPRVLIPEIQELIRELREQRSTIAELEIEMRQKIASRTDALERTIGSLRQQATRDSLTGLFNRRFLDQYLQQSFQRHQKDRKDLCLLMIDVDNFKLLNDTLGHATGDDLLRAIGQLIRSAIRGEDVAFRCGGDEFVILLPSSTIEAGKTLADRLTSLVDQLGKTIKVTTPPALSIGMATLKAGDHPSPQSLLDQADRALYDVKKARRAGRISREGLNVTVSAVQSPPPSRKAG
jgi:diguanylate cyclase (GGDEF)-like protein